MVSLGRGTDVLDAASAWRPVVADGGPGADSLGGGLADDDLAGSAGTDDFDGGPGDDRLRGGADIDDLRGGSGSDELIGGDGTDVVDGGAGGDLIVGAGDVLTYETRTLGVHVTPQDGPNDGEPGEDDDVRGTFWRIEGGSGDDTIAGATTEFIAGGAGDDHLYGGDGGDSIEGGDGNDEISGGDGDDVEVGGAGSDVLTGGGGADYLNTADGEADRLLDCGQGDLARVDVNDLLSSLCPLDTSTDAVGPASGGPGPPDVRADVLRNARRHAYVRLRVLSHRARHATVLVRIFDRRNNELTTFRVDVATNRVVRLSRRLPAAADHAEAHAVE